MGALDGKVAAITGASSGIGEATALALVAEGAAVSLAARREDRIEDLAARIDRRRRQGAARSRPTSPTRTRPTPSSTATNDELGGLDVLVNNAGVMLLGPVAGAPTEQWRQMIDVNLARPPLLHPRGAADHGRGRQRRHRQRRLRRRPVAAMGSGVYNMTKWGVVGFSEALRQECAHANVRVTAIEPGWVDTELQGHNEHPMVVEAMNKMIDAIDKVLEAGRHRPRDRLRRHPARARQHQRDADPADDLEQVGSCRRRGRRRCRLGG